MSFFTRNFKIISSAEQNIKENLIAQLKENVKEVQFEYQESGKDYLELNDCTNSLCTTLEAIFLHGLKDSFLWQTMNVIAGDIERRPNPNFWPLLLIFLHTHTIEQIESLSQINTDIGNCRSWIRISLNESLFSSYLNNIRKNTTALNPYYKKYAFLKDFDIIDVAAKLIEGIEACVQVHLPTNSSLLNQWTNLPLQMSGIWTAPIISCPIASGIDVAGSLTDKISIPTPQPLQTKEFFSESIRNSPFSRGPSMLATAAANDFDDSENLKIFLQKIEQMEQVPEENITEYVEKDSYEAIENEIDITIATIAAADDPNKEIAQFGNSIKALNKSWSIDESIDDHQNEQFNCNNNNNDTVKEDKPNELTNNNTNQNLVSRSNSMTTSVSSLRSPIERYSYDMLLTKHKRNRSQHELNIQDVWERFEHNLANRQSIASTTTSDTNENAEIENESDDDTLGFEIVIKEMVDTFTINELQEMVRYLCKLARELGLDSQGFVCKSCSHPLGIGFANAQVCAFSGHYFCESCISQEQFIIPAKIIYNLDFRRYTVSKRAAIFLNEFQYQPFINLEIHNPDIYQASDEMSHLQSLRIQLNFIRAYLYNCCELTIDGFKKQVESKEYLYEHIHQYSIADLYMIPRGQLGQLLQKTLQFGEQHILKCQLCSVKGFICEKCKSPKVLYPFHIDTTFRCEECGAVFHDQCLNKSQPCPKCERKQRREDLPLMEAINML